MELVTTVEHHFERTQGGHVWTRTGFAHGFWARYLAAFERVRVVARVRDVAGPAPGAQRADGEGVRFAAVPDYTGPLEHLLARPSVVAAIRAVVDGTQAFIVRPGAIAGVLLGELARRDLPYAIEVIGDPAEVFAPGVVRHPLRPLFRWHFARGLERACRGAIAAVYVTERTLQDRYPCPALAVGISDVELDREAFAEPRTFAPALRPLRVVLVGSLAQLYKGPDTLLDAVAACARRGVAVNATLVGDGRFRPELERRAVALGIADRVVFRGQLASGAAVRDELDAADVFALPSRTEGLPRALLEAMARALPCVASNVGGIPELLEEGALIEPGDAEGLARRLVRYANDGSALTAMSRRNAERARAFSEASLRTRRAELYRFVRRRTEEWLARGERRLAAPGPRGGVSMTTRVKRQRGWRRAVKSALDRTAALVGLVLLAPLFALIALLVRATMGAPVIFRHTRPGLEGRPFVLLKFRSMSDARDKNGDLLPDRVRTTRLGRILRATSLDELPQLWNVLRGDLSLVGPRPLLAEFLPHYGTEEARRHDVMPGMTGLAQVSGRQGLTFEEKLALDRRYVDEWSLGLDLAILARTLLCLLRRDLDDGRQHPTSLPPTLRPARRERPTTEVAA